MTQLFSYIYRPRHIPLEVFNFLVVLCAQDISTDMLIVIMHEKNKTESSLSTCIYTAHVTNIRQRAKGANVA